MERAIGNRRYARKRRVTTRLYLRIRRIYARYSHRAATQGRPYCESRVRDVGVLLHFYGFFNEVIDLVGCKLHGGLLRGKHLTGGLSPCQVFHSDLKGEFHHLAEVVLARFGVEFFAGEDFIGDGEHAEGLLAASGSFHIEGR